MYLGAFFLPDQNFLPSASTPGRVSQPQQGVQKLPPILDNLGRTQEAPQDGADATTMPASRVARQQHRPHAKT